MKFLSNQLWASLLSPQPFVPDVGCQSCCLGMVVSNLVFPLLYSDYSKSLSTSSLLLPSLRETKQRGEPEAQKIKIMDWDKTANHNSSVLMADHIRKNLDNSHVFAQPSWSTPKNSWLLPPHTSQTQQRAPALSPVNVEYRITDVE